MKCQLLLPDYKQNYNVFTAFVRLILNLMKINLAALTKFGVVHSETGASLTGPLDGVRTGG